MVERKTRFKGGVPRVMAQALTRSRHCLSLCSMSLYSIRQLVLGSWVIGLIIRLLLFSDAKQTSNQTSNQTTVTYALIVSLGEIYELFE
jgi:hypothetical protein